MTPRYAKFVVQAVHSDPTDVSAPVRVVVSCNICQDRQKLPLIVFSATLGNMGKHVLPAMDNHNHARHRMARPSVDTITTVH